MGKRRIPIGKILSGAWIGCLLAVATLALLFVTAPAFPQNFGQQTDTSFVAPPPQLAVANDGNWSTEILIGNTGNAPVTFETEPCRIFPCYRWTVIPGGAARVSTLPSGFSLLPAPNADSVSFLRFDDGGTSASYAVGPMGSIMGSASQTFGPIINDEGMTTTINVFPSAFTALQVEVLDGNGELVATQTFEALPPVAQFSISPSVSVGSLRITNRQLFGVTGTPQPIYGFVAVADRRGGNARTLTFR